MSLAAGTGFAIAGLALSGAPALALDPGFDPMRLISGPTAGAPSETQRGIQRDIDHAPTLTERFGLPRAFGPISFGPLPVSRGRPVAETPASLRSASPRSAPPRPAPVQRARRSAPRDG